MGGGGLDGRSWARTRVGTTVGGKTHSRRSRGRRSLLCVRVREATHHGEAMARAGGEVGELEVRRKRRAKGPASPPGLRCARAGVHACARASWLAQTHARTRTHRHGATATKAGRLPTARGARLGRRRARVGEGGDTFKKTRPSLARWPASPAAARSGGRSALA
jgi:hypothetical protein